ncbi:MAG TPA: glycerophosphodiester phosphodiesterase family protein, partial [Acidimicrobiales bacterium]|nr:glycerophosphodiester phosphodiesterase family protein [Acidimicrobiales bacterium]
MGERMDRRELLKRGAAGSVFLTAGAGLLAACGSRATAGQRNPSGLSLVAVPEPWYIGHRGMPALYPECSLDGYKAAITAGVDVVSIPYFVLRDGSLGVMHDATLDRTTASSGVTANQTADVWRNLVVDTSSWFPGFPDGHPPFLQDVLDIVGGKALVILQGKNPGTGKAGYDEVKQRGLLASTMFSSTSPVEFKPFLAGKVPCSLQPTSTQVTAKQILLTGAAAANLDYASTGNNSSFVRSLVRGGVKVYSSLGSGQGFGRRTFRDDFLTLGVSGLYCDDP